MPTKDRFAITPLLVESDELYSLSMEVAHEAGKLAGAIHPLTAKAAARLVINMNSYYSNLIEGHFTHPADIENALKKDYSKDEKKRRLQQESTAHIGVNEAMRAKLQSEDTAICSTTFLCWLHGEFYKHLPEEMRTVNTGKGEKWEVIPGELRHRDVTVWDHLAPSYEALPAFMELFEDSYEPAKITNAIKKIIAIAASHHRFVWIHPFLDGNGRVARLFSEALFINAGLDANGLWSISRGLAVYKNEYYERLKNADNPRLNDYDGRGSLSERYLNEFCIFFLKTALDQIKFMSNLFEVDAVLERIKGFVKVMAASGELRPESAFMLRDIFLRGKISKGEIMHVTGRSEPVAREIMNSLLAKELIKTESDEFRAPLVLNFPVRYAPYFFPRLYPPEIESTLIA